MFCLLDFRHHTFLALCRIGSYTKTAEALNMTQPGVTQHIQYLEEQYGGKLFLYKNRKLSLTKRGEQLYAFATRLQSDSRQIQSLLRAKSENSTPLLFGATLTIGEYVMPGILQKMLIECPELLLSMHVDNTKVLLDKLRLGEIHFALLEGYFNKAEYASEPMRTERFIPVCSARSTLANREVSLEELLGFNLILRESGSGTRDILEHALLRYNLSVQSFHHVYEIGNMSAIKQLVAAEVGISFLYAAAAKQELKAGILSEIQVIDFSSEHDFSFVFLKDSIHAAQFLSWCRLFKDAMQ